MPKEEASKCTQDEIGDNVADGNAIVQLRSWNDIPAGLTASPGLVQKHFDVGCFDQMTNKGPEKSNQINGLVLLYCLKRELLSKISELCMKFL